MEKHKKKKRTVVNKHLDLPFYKVYQMSYKKKQKKMSTFDKEAYSESSTKQHLF